MKVKASNNDILITGAGGWLGSELTEQLLAQGKSVRAINFIYTERLENLKKKYGEKLNIIIGDICNNELIKKELQGVKVVYHLAAKVHAIPTNQKEEEDFFRVNSKATEELFKQCIINNVDRVIFFSTVSVYKTTNEKITLNTAKEPDTIYGKSKLEAEKIANKMYNEQQLPVTIIEPVTVYGEGDVGNFKKLENLIKKGLCIKFGNGNNKKTVIYYRDLIKMVIEIAQNNAMIGKTVICGTEVLTLNEINDILIKSSAKRVIKITIPMWLTNITIKLCSISILKKIKRKIIALTQNNEFEIENNLNSYTKFKEYELK